MKLINFYGVSALGLIFAACSSDDLSMKSDDNSTASDRMLYVNVHIRGDVEGTDTRSSSSNGSPSDSDFDKGDGESNVRSAWFVFYDNTGKQVGNIVESAISTEWSDGTTNSVDKYYKSTVGVRLKNGENSPSQVICYLNPTSTTDFTKSIEDIQEVTRTVIRSASNSTDEKYYFPMSNSVYYANTSSLAPEIATPVNASQLHETEADAKNDTDPVNIYVERYAAKLKFKSGPVTPYEAATKNITGNTTATNVELTFVPKRWVLNAACTETYIVKSYRKETPEGGNMLDDNYSYPELNTIINPSGASRWAWNNNTYHRSYWGMSPAYFTGTYPDVSSDVENLKDNLKQHYYSYNELTGTNPAGFAVVDADNNLIETTTYSFETTVGSKALKSTNPAAALPSVIIVGDYKIKVGNTEVTGTPNFYTYLTDPESGKTLIYFDADDNGSSQVTGGESMLRRFIDRASTILYKKIGDSYEAYDPNKESDMTTLASIFTIAVPNVDVIGDVKLAERFRTLQFNNEDINSVNLSNIYIGTSKGYLNVVIPSEETTVGAGEISIIDANKELVNTVGYCEMYQAGAAYFNIPVRHLGWYRSAHSEAESASNQITDWSKVNVGDYGIVRNHSYDISVNQITGLGTGIGGKDNPIVPPVDEKTYHIAYQINILKWAVLPTQSINL